MSENTKTDKATKTVSAPHPCACLTGTGAVCPSITRKLFAQGHDARMSSRLAQAVAAGEMTNDEAVAAIKQAGAGALLISKTLHSAKLRAGKPAKGEKSDRPAKKEQVSLIDRSSPAVLGTVVKAWHGKRDFKATIVRNASGDLVARHRLSGKDCNHAVEVEDGEVMVGPAK